MGKTQTKTTLYVGANDKDTKRQKIADDKQREIIAGVCYDHTDGATIYTGTGIYKHGDGAKVSEKSTIVILYNVAQFDIMTICQKIKTALNQESIAVEYTQVNFDFV